MRLRTRFLVVPAVTAALLAVLGGCSGIDGGAQVVSGEWPKICCRTAGDMLDEITTLANAARPGAPPEVVVLIDRVLQDVQRCGTNTPPCALPDGEHCRKVEAALTNARLGAWLPCANELEHGH